MTGVEMGADELANLVASLRNKGRPFAVATVVRTLGATAAKPGAKAVLDSDGNLLEGWVGGGCVRGALSRAVVESLANSEPVLVSLHPEALLDEKGLQVGETEPGVKIARNGCPSEGSMDIFVEPHLPLPELVVIGASPVARALVGLAPRFDWDVNAVTGATDVSLEPGNRRRMVVVSTQGQGDAVGLILALRSGAEFVAFVGSRRKFRSLHDTLRADGFAPEELDAVCAPAGLAIDAVTPDEIALSILAQLTQCRRQRQRDQSRTQ